MRFVLTMWLIDAPVHPQNPNRFFRWVTGMVGIYNDSADSSLAGCLHTNLTVVSEAVEED